MGEPGGRFRNMPKPFLVDKDSGGTAAYIEAGVGVHKTMGAKLMRGQLLPIVAPLWEWLKETGLSNTCRRGGCYVCRTLLMAQ